MPPVKKSPGTFVALELSVPQICIKSISVLFKHPKILGVPGRSNLVGGMEE